LHRSKYLGFITRELQALRITEQFNPKDYYIPRTKTALLQSLKDLGVKGITKLRKMGYKQLLVIYAKARREKC